MKLVPELDPDPLKKGLGPGTKLGSSKKYGSSKIILDPVWKLKKPVIDFDSVPVNPADCL